MSFSPFYLQVLIYNLFTKISVNLKLKQLFTICCRCIKLSIVHDMAESIVGDLTPADRIDKSEKTLREEVGIVKPVLRGHHWDNEQMIL